MNFVLAKRLVAFATMNACLLLFVPPENVAGWIVFAALNAMGIFLVMSGVLIPPGRSQQLFAYALTSVVMIAVAIQALITTLVLLIDPLGDWASGALPFLLGVEVSLISTMLWAALFVGQRARTIAKTTESDSGARAFQRRAALTAEGISVSAASPSLKRWGEKVQEEILYGPVAIDTSVFPLEASIQNSLEMAATAMRAGDEATAERHLEVCSGYLRERAQRLRFRQ